jgi:lactam utilization protein B
MKNFLAKIVYQIVGAENLAVEQFDEQLCLIVARNSHEAFFKARMLGVKNEDEVITDRGHGLYWKFVDVPYIKELQSLMDGEEL